MYDMRIMQSTAGADLFFLSHSVGLLLSASIMLSTRESRWLCELLAYKLIA